VNNLQQNMTCSCSLGFRLLTGINFNLDCVFKNDICLDDMNTYCGLPKIKTNLYRRRKTSLTSIEFDAKPLSGVGTGGPVDPGPIIVNVNHTVPIRLLDPIVFKSCNATLDGEACRKCDICDNKKQVLFDCSNVQLAAAYYAPAFNQCLGLDDE
jgi:hypothetical protein